MRMLVIAAAIIGAIWGYFQAYPYLTKTSQVRYRLTATVQTPDGLRTGSGVWGYSKAASWSSPTYNIIPFYESKWIFSGRVDGEAIPVELGRGKTIYMALGGRVMPHQQYLSIKPAFFSNGFMNVMPDFILETQGVAGHPLFGQDRAGAVREIDWLKAQKNRTLSLDCSPAENGNSMGDCPAFVAADRSGSQITLIDPDDFAATLGVGYRLKGVSLRVVDDPVTSGIKRYLPWVEAWPVPGYYKDDELRKTGFARHDPVHQG